jgi:hypothetical protein
MKRILAVLAAATFFVGANQVQARTSITSASRSRP